MNRTVWANRIVLMACLAFIGCNSLEKEYAIVREIQNEGQAKDREELTPQKIASSGFENERNHIVELILSNQEMPLLSKKIGELKYLKRLELDGNKLTTLPNEIGSLAKLEYLTIAGNSLASLPDSFKNLRNLKTLYLSNNQLTEIPSYLLQYSQLEDLSVMNNRIKVLDPRFTKLPKLMSLNIDSNYICNALMESEPWLNEHSGIHWHETQRCQ